MSETPVQTGRPAGAVDNTTTRSQRHNHSNNIGSTRPCLILDSASSQPSIVVKGRTFQVARLGSPEGLHSINPDKCLSVHWSDDRGLPPFPLQTACQKEARGIPLRSSGQKDRDTGLPQHHAELRIRRETLFLHWWDLILIILCIWRICTPHIVCPRSLRACISPVLTGMLRFLIRSR